MWRWAEGGEIRRMGFVGGVGIGQEDRDMAMIWQGHDG
ncbi:hypothetical protein GGR08_000565 [Bartonella fuyuanensis]|uniref:Uncharacterized protein n=1 Tax=Bartonella fuyuanensis TaxID=1460968 RepID=A0A840DXL6_9HYPH|nr:hypothetical protein [Bartonella fuyuanensis]